MFPGNSWNIRPMSGLIRAENHTGPVISKSINVTIMKSLETLGLLKRCLFQGFLLAALGKRLSSVRKTLIREKKEKKSRTVIPPVPVTVSGQSQGPSSIPAHCEELWDGI